MPNSLCTGHRGFIGSHVFEAVDRCEGLEKADDLWPKKYETIYHLGFDASIPDSFERPDWSHLNNVGRTLEILQLARETGAKVVFSSSSSVYDLMSPYSLEKYICEQYLAFYWKTWGVKSVALRYTNVYGEGQDRANGGYALALSKFLKQYKDKEPFTIVGDGTQRRDFVYVGDVVQANIQASKWLDTATEFKVFDVGTGTNYSINEVCDMIDAQHPKVYLPPRIEPLIGLADVSKRLPGWEPQVTLESWLSSI